MSGYILIRATGFGINAASTGAAPIPKPGVVAPCRVSPFGLLMFRQQFRDLDCVGGGAFAEIVGHTPERNAIGV